MNNTKGTRQNFSVTSGKRELKEYDLRGGSDCLLKTQDFAK